MADVVVRPATADDFIAFTGSLPHCRTRAWVGEIDGRIIGMGGVAYPPDGPVPVMWADYSEEARAHALTLHKQAVKFLASLDHKRLVCVADKSVPATRRWLERLGFVASGKVTDDGEIYIHDRHRDTHSDRDLAGA